MNYDAMVKDTVERMLGEPPPDIEDEDGITDRSTYEAVVQALVVNSRVRWKSVVFVLTKAHFSGSLTRLLRPMANAHG